MCAKKHDLFYLNSKEQCSITECLSIRQQHSLKIVYPWTLFFVIHFCYFIWNIICCIESYLFDQNERNINQIDTFNIDFQAQFLKIIISTTTIQTKKLKINK